MKGDTYFHKVTHVALKMPTPVGPVKELSVQSCSFRERDGDVNECGFKDCESYDVGVALFHVVILPLGKKSSGC